MGESVIRENFIKYDQFLVEENVLIQRIGVCKEFIEVLLKYISGKSDSIRILTAEDIVNAVHAMSQDLDTELLHVRLEKSLLENKIKNLEANCD
ncbi:hypothetical protein [Paenibacillus periandrae]|uniref:hypothetical protein n=1 Tax=Paenibacillus periandrae TaxID=1761741 RepID=UPI001F09C978|nr:hypothetical protein [Paenibacillus periandrae]